MAKKKSQRPAPASKSDNQTAEKWPLMLKPYGKSTLGVARIRRVVREVVAERKANESR